jgi:hypothetical protein
MIFLMASTSSRALNSRRRVHSGSTPGGGAISSRYTYTKHTYTALTYQILTECPIHKLPHKNDTLHLFPGDSVTYDCLALALRQPHYFPYDD